ncbi:MAG: diguanylate cyclase [Campylobacterota bacterium]|nr:diguanylate cyclase [Campylobacterota bacterium]
MNEAESVIDCNSVKVKNSHCKKIDSILIIEDSQLLQKKIKDEITAKLKIVCDVASTEKEAKELLEKNSYDLLIVDLYLPDGNPDFIYYLIRKKFSILVMTASTNEEQRAKLVSLPIVDYLYKTDEKSITNYLVNKIERLNINRDLLVIICDDSALARHQVVDLLKTQNLPYIEVENGMEAYSCTLDSPQEISLLITDINMPLMNGIELITKIRNTYTLVELPILAYSSADKTSTIAQLIKTGANDFISKPINREEVLTRIDNTLKLSCLFKKNQDLISKLNTVATTDFLTNLYNRNHFYQIIEHIQAKSKRDSRYYGIIMMDIDFFKQINDNYGHKFGDTVLKSVAQIIKESSRDADMVHRWGGEEFIVLVPDTSIEELARFAQRIRKNVEKEKMTSDNSIVSINITISCGVAIANDTNIDNVENVINLADERLYKAKESGRNQVVYK